jgi:hypothetical protein
MTRPPLARPAMPPQDEERKNPFVKGSVYRIVSLGTQEAPVETQGTFVGFTNFGMTGEGVMIELGTRHGDAAGKLRVIPLHMVLHLDVIEGKEEQKEKQDEGHPVSYS